MNAFDFPPPFACALSPNPDWLKRFVHLVLRNLLSALQASLNLSDFVGLPRESGVILVSLAGFALLRWWMEAALRRHGPRWGLRDVADPAALRTGRD